MVLALCACFVSVLQTAGSASAAAPTAHVGQVSRLAATPAAPARQTASRALKIVRYGSCVATTPSGIQAQLSFRYYSTGNLELLWSNVHELKPPPGKDGHRNATWYSVLDNSDYPMTETPIQPPRPAGSIAGYASPSEDRVLMGDNGSVGLRIGVAGLTRYYEDCRAILYPRTA